jgi:heme oxygenase
MIASRLKEETKIEHAAVEKELMQIIRKIDSIEKYVSLLSIMYGYYASVERSVQPYLGPDNFPDFDARRKSESILQDILYFSGTARPSLCLEIPVADSYSRALGMVYVMEGSTLGGKIIAGVIARQLNIPSDQGFSFFLSYKDKTQYMWESFKQHLEKTFDDREQEQVIDSARQTFNTLKTWICQHAEN